MLTLNMDDIDTITNNLYQTIKEKRYDKDFDTKPLEKTYEKMCKISNMRFEQRTGDILIPITRKAWEKY